MDLKELQEEILRLTDLNATLTNEIENLKATYEDKEKEYITFKEESQKRITELQEHNQKLFLKVTHKVEDKKEVQKFKSKLLGNYADTLSEEQLEQLKAKYGEIEGESYKRRIDFRSAMKEKKEAKLGKPASLLRVFLIATIITGLLYFLLHYVEKWQ